MIVRIYKDTAKDKPTLSWIKKSTRDLLFPWNKQTSLTLEVTIVILNVIVKGPCMTLSFRIGYLSLSAVQLEITWISICVFRCGKNEYCCGSGCCSKVFVRWYMWWVVYSIFSRVRERIVYLIILGGLFFGNFLKTNSPPPQKKFLFTELRYLERSAPSTTPTLF